MSVGELWTPKTHLPHPDYWLVDPEKEKMDTPLDDRGLVDPYLLVKNVLSTLSSDFNPKFLKDTHHLYWPKCFYPRGTVDRQFREIAPHKVKVPQDLHGWIHRVTLPPKMPDTELVQHHVEFYDAARELFHAVRRIVQLQREKDRLLGKLPPQTITGTVKSRQKGIATNKRNVERYMERLATVPTELMPVVIDVSDNPKRIAQKVAVIALKTPFDFDSELLAA